MIDHDRRRIRNWNVTEHPNAPWIWQQMIEATAWGQHASSIWAADLFTVQTLAFRTLYVRSTNNRDRPRDAGAASG